MATVCHYCLIAGVSSHDHVGNIASLGISLAHPNGTKDGHTNGSEEGSQRVRGRWNCQVYRVAGDSVCDVLIVNQTTWVSLMCLNSQSIFITYFTQSWLL